MAFAAQYDFEKAPNLQLPVTSLAQWSLPASPPQLAEIRIANVPLTNFTPGVYTYWANQAAAQMPAVTAVAKNPGCGIQIKPAAQAPGVTEILVTDKTNPTRTAKYRILHDIKKN